MSDRSGQAYWNILIKLNRALLDEPSFHRRRAIILTAMADLTDQPGHLWLVEDGQPFLEALPSLLKQVAFTGQAANNDETREQAYPLRHRQTGQFLGALAGNFHSVPVDVVEALAAQAQLAFEYPTPDTRIEHLLTMAEVSRAVVSELDVDALLQLVANLLNERFGYPFIHIFVVHPGRRLIEFKAGYGPYVAQFKGEGLTFSLDDHPGIIAWVARNGQSALVNNVYEDSRFIPFVAPGIDIKSELAAPLIFGEHVLGVFDVESEALNAFTPNDRWLLETLAANIAIALRNATLYHSERWRRQAADSLRQIAGVVRTKETLENTLAAILRELATVLPLEFAAIWLKTEGGFAFKVGYGLDQPLASEPIANAWFDQIVAARSSLIRQAGDASVPLGLALPADHSAVGAVLQVYEHTLGVLVLVDRQPRRFGQEAQRLIEIFAGQAAIVIENTELYHQAQAEAWVSTALLQVAEATRNLQTLNEVLSAITRLTPLIAGVDACAIWLRGPTLEAGAESYRLAADYGFARGEVEFLQTYTLPAASLLAIRLAVLKEPLVISAAAATEELPVELRVIFAGRATLCLPLLSQGGLNGVMMMRFEAKWAPTEQQFQMLRGIAHQTAAAIQTAQLLEAQQEEAYVSTALLQVAQVVVMQAELGEILQTIVRITPLLTGVGYCLVFLYHGAETSLLAAQYGLEGLALPVGLALADFAELRAAIVAGEQTTIQAEDRLPPVLREAGLSGLREGLIIPLRVKADVVGALMVVDTLPQARLAGKRKDIITGVAYQTALAVDNARLYAERARQEQLTRELELAQEIQTAFIPRTLPGPAGWELATFWKMAREVGGDFFDVIPLPYNQLLVMIADVSGKGIPAALFMALTRSLVQAVALELTRPGDILARVNHLILPNNQRNMFVSMFCAVFDLNLGRATYASAGHNPPILVRQSAKTCLLRAQGTVLGVLEEVVFEQKEVVLQDGEGILLYTDGITETFNPEGEIFGEERLREALRAHWSLPAHEIVQAINQAVFHFSGSEPQSDDRTLLLLKKKSH